ncbi:DUF2298 domain-containing protein [Natrinema salsiterrestre]|uniref:DUF2298 domain-containing protein n=1 Tax=Natrinema salsiterrestre TaxID=2950540 RepID=A0A9Q4L4L9_9EURY|nr:DUF2298 domain-containing protein [Natrinema salsiterrestre]MDF9746758.1 DUF2298 domain-containing protein [Natrinema salsiterrestre]
MIGDLAIVGRWFFVLLVLLGLGVPVASVLFASLPGRGAGFALPTSLTIVGFLVFWFGHVRFGGMTVVAAVAILAIATVFFVARGVPIDRRATVESALVFAATFAFIVGVLSLNPSLLPQHEHFLNHSILQSILRGETLPPEDPWFAGEPIQYHYGGPLLSAILVELSGVDPRYGHNLAVATVYALLVTGSYELAGSIAVARDRSRRLAGLLGAFFVGIAGNLFVPLIVVTSRVPDRIAEPLLVIFAPHLTWARAELLWDGLSEFRYDDPKFLIEEGLTPVPLLEALHGELHAHLSSAPFLVFTAALLYAYYRTPLEDRRRRRALLFAAVPIAIGTTTVIDVWTLPTALGLCWLVVAFDSAGANVAARLRRADGSETEDRLVAELSSVLRATVAVIAIGVLTVASSAPLFATISVESGTVALIGSDQRTTGPQLVLLYGAFAGVTIVYFVVVDRVDSTVGGDQSTDGGTQRTRTVTIPVLNRETSLRRLELAGTAVLALLLWLTIDLAAGVIFGPLLVLAWWTAREDDNFAMVLLVAVSVMLLTIEFVYLDDPDPIVVGRTNTLFRAYFQTWVLWGIAAGVLSARLLTRDRLPSRDRPVNGGAVLVAVVLVMTSLYGGIAFAQFVHGSTSPPDNTGYYSHEPPGLEVSSVHETRTYSGTDFDTTLSSGIIDGEIVASGAERRVWSGPYTWLQPGVYEIVAVVNATAESEDEDERVGTVAVEGRIPHEREQTRFETMPIGETDGYERVSTTVRINRTHENVVVAGELEEENATIRLKSVSVTHLETLDGRSGVTVNDEDPTLDGHLYAKALHPAEMDAISWLDDHVEGQPTMASAPGGRWRWDSAPSSLTGIPTVVGWEHQRVYRDETAYYERTHDVDALYQGTPAERVDILEKYDVQYVHAGPLEQDRYGEVRPFTELEGVSIAYENDAVTIYEIDHDELEYDGTYEITERYRYEPADFRPLASSAELKDGRLVATGARDFAWYGPRDLFHPGTYEVTYYLDVSGGTESKNGAVALDTTAGMVRGQTEAEVLANQTVNETDGLRAVTQEFDLKRTRGDVEFRGRLLDPTATVELERITVVLERNPEDETGAADRITRSSRRMD